MAHCLVEFRFFLLLLYGLNLTWDKFGGIVELVLAMIALGQPKAGHVEQVGVLFEED